MVFNRSDKKVVFVILNRILHHSNVVKITDNSYSLIGYSSKKENTLQIILSIAIQSTKYIFKLTFTKCFLKRQTSYLNIYILTIKVTSYIYFLNMFK